ncbi:MAG: hypothetical protein PHZ28_03890 [Candidatus Izemoplasmatales bacterium]|nr:hypothetical protein [Candidatus Izemoplasmatales bacterium]
MPNVSQIKRFLREVKNADYIDFVPRDKNVRTRLLIGLTAFEQEEIVRNLRVDEYFNGPSKDKDPNRKGLVWVFKHTYENHTLYIKLKELIIIESIKVIKCLSIHIDYM